jgi:diguanylate cyclase (GGDEF)-like protein
LNAVLLPVGPLNVSIALFFFLALASFGRRATPGARAFSVLMVSIAAYVGGYALKLSARGPEAILSATKIEYLGYAPMAVLWYLFARSFTGSPRLKPSLVLALFAVPTAVLAWIWGGGLGGSPFAPVASQEQAEIATALLSRRGALYWIMSAYTAALNAGVIALFAASLRRRAPGRKAQIGLALAGSVVPLATGLAYALRLLPFELDPMPFALDISGVLFGLAIFRYDLLATAFIGRERVVDSLADGIVVVDPSGRIADANPAARRILRLGDDCIGERLAERGSGAALSSLVAGIVDKAEFTADVGGIERKYAARASSVGSPRNERAGTALVVSDITELSALLARLMDFAVTDELTGLNNRRSFLDKVKQEFSVARRAGRPLSIIMLDLDRFKNINDSYGHAAGDAVLRAASERMLRQLRLGDLLCRYGGDEFAAFMPETDAEGAMVAAERLRRAVGEGRVAFEGGTALASASAGLFGGVPAEGESVEDFLHRADIALYEAKEAGRDRIAFWRAST